MNIALALLAVAGVPAGAAVPSFSPTYVDKEVEGWLVYSSPKYCWMMKRYPDGTDLKFNWSTAKSESYLNLVSAKFGWVGENEYYDLNVSIDGWSATIEATGRDRRDGTYSLSFFASDPVEFRNLIEKGERISFKLSDRVVGNYSLNGSAKALKELVRCEEILPRTADEEDTESNGND